MVQMIFYIMKDFYMTVMVSLCRMWATYSYTTQTFCNWMSWVLLQSLRPLRITTFAIICFRFDHGRLRLLNKVEMFEKPDVSIDIPPIIEYLVQ